MAEKLSKSSWLMLPLFIAILLGIGLGVALAQNSMNTAIPLLVGWLFFPSSLSALFSADYVDHVTHVPGWLIRFILLSYPLAMLTASACTYWMLQSTWKRRQALLCVVLLACVSALICIPIGMLAPSFNSNGTMAVTPVLVLPVWLNLLFSAVLGWGIGCLIPRRKLEAAA